MLILNHSNAVQFQNKFEGIDHTQTGSRHVYKRDPTDNQEIGLIALKQFRFKLQAVLDYRTEQLNKVQQKVAEEEQKRASIFNRIREFDSAIEQSLLDQQNLLQGELNPVQLQNFPNYLWRLKQDRFQTFQALQAQERKLIAVREELKQAMIKKKSLDILKDKDLTQYRKQIEKAEEEFLAEIAINRAVRNNRAMI